MGGSLRPRNTRSWPASGTGSHARMSFVSSNGMQRPRARMRSLSQNPRSVVARSSITKNVRGVLDGNVVKRWIETHMGRPVPLVIPLVFIATILDRRRAERFSCLPPALPSIALPTPILSRLRAAFGGDVPLRLATHPGDVTIVARRPLTRFGIESRDYRS
jgi:hypothetical protein